MTGDGVPRIGGSDIAAIMGISTFKGATKRAAYMHVMGLAEESPDTPWFEWGKRLEAVIIDKFRDAHRDELARVEYGVKLANPAIPFAGGSPDAVCVWQNGATSIFDAKTANAFVADEWGDMSGHWDGLPPQYFAQVQWYLMLLPQACKATVGVLLGGSDYREYDTAPRYEFHAEMLAAAREFYETYICAMTPPPLDDGDDVRVEMAVAAGIVAANAEAEEAILALRNADTAQKITESSYAAAVARVKELIGENAGISGPGYEVTWRADKRGRRTFRVKFQGVQE